MKIINVVGARPNFIKIMPLLKAMKKNRSLTPVLVHTGQHYDYNMSEIFFKHLNIPKPDIFLGVGSGAHGQQTGMIMRGFEPVLEKEKPDLVVVVGDVNSTLACCLTAVKLHIPVAHIEAGLRSFDRRMPEEINRVVTDSISQYLFTPSSRDDQNLIREGIPKSQIFCVGNIMADTLLYHVKQIKAHRKNLLSAKKDYAVLTLHRAGNVDHPQIFSHLARILRKLSESIPIYFPVHPRTRKQIKKFSLTHYFKDPIHLLKPLGYLEFLKLYSQAQLVLTDSGGLQAETTLLNIPCLTLRENTEWTITLTHGTNALAGLDEKKIFSQVHKILKGQWKKRKPIPFWDGSTADRIVDILTRQSR